MKKKKGFTLIELLAVIVILAIIALIATPVILNIIEKSRKSAFTRSLESVVRAGKIYYMDSIVDDTVGEINFRCTKDGCTSDKTDSNGNQIVLDIEGNVGTGDITIDNKGNISFELEYSGYCGTKEIDENKINVEKGNCAQFDPENDTTPPVINSVNYTKTQNSVKIVVNAKDKESGIVYYEYSIDNGDNYTEQQTNNVYEFKDLEPGTYKIRVRVYSGAYEYHPEIGMVESEPIEVVLEEAKACIEPTLESVTPEEWSESKTVIVNYGKNCEGEYSLDNSSSWNDGNEVTVTENQTIVFQNEAGTFSYQVTGIKPVITLGEVEIKATSITIPFEINVDDANEATCEYGLDEDYGKTGTIENGACVIDNLEPETEYYYKLSVTQQDNSGTDEIIGSEETLESPIQPAPNGKEGLIAIAYFDPTAGEHGEACTKEQHDTNLNNHTSDGVQTTPTELNSGCMKWYVFKDNNNGTVDMLLDHNTVANVEFSVKTSPYLTQEQLINELETILANSISNWSNTITARLITGDDIAEITNNQTWNKDTTTSTWYFETHGGTSQPNPYTGAYSWLYDYTCDCTSYGCEVDDSNSYPTTKTTGVTTSNSYSYGYWTSTPYASSSASVWNVRSYGYLYRSVSSNAGYGLRPVITVSKSTLGL